MNIWGRLNTNTKYIEFMVGKPNKMSRRKGIKAAAGTISGLAVFPISVSGQSESELKSDLKQAYGEKEGEILYDIIKDKQISDGGLQSHETKNQYEEITEEVLDNSNLKNVKEEIERIDRRKPKTRRDGEEDGLTRNGHKIYRVDVEEATKDGKEIIERLEKGDKERLEELELDTHDSEETSTWQYGDSDAEDGSLGSARARTERETGSSYYESAHAEANVYGYGTAWAYARLQAAQVDLEGGANYNVTVDYNRYGHPF
ncbi:hypothetical protein [Natrarchaeobaculum aegyptiacum]|uniref:hypothetical protein n=1 Tax=Natrarchaeobaculum aegyptiacum TaxID=745377 RepID=UPI001374827A|nr:hypothetical protein [Natrarchaeobaculum aegyptiacum]